MNRLTKITSGGPSPLKARRFTLELAGLDLIAGPNGSGKTTRLLGIWGGTRGLADVNTDLTRPYVGEKPAGTVTMSFDQDGRARSITRDLSLGLRAKDSTRIDEQLAPLVGRHVACWDLRDFAAMTSGTRERYLQEILRAGAFESSLGWSDIQELAIDALELKEDAGHIWDELIGVTNQGAADESPIQDLGTWVPSATAKLKTWYTESNGGLSQAKAAVKAMHNRAGEDPEGDPDVIREQLESAEEELRKVRSDLDRADESAKRVEATRRNRETQARRAQELTDRLARMDTELAGLRVPPKDPEELEATVSSLTATLDEARANTEKMRATLTSAREAYVAKKSERDALASKEQTLRSLADPDASCVHCGAADPLGLLAKADQAAAELEEVERDLQSLERTGKIKQLAVKKGTEIVDHLVAKKALAEKALADLGDVLNRRNTILTDKPKVESELEEVKVSLHESAGDDLEVLDPAELQASRDDLTGRIGELRRSVAAHNAAEDQEGRLQKAVADRQAADKRLKEIKACQKLVADVADRVASDAYKPLSAMATELLTAAGLNWSVEIRGPDEFGLVKHDEDDLFVTWWLLSDAERAIAGASLAQAFARASGAPWRALLLDGVESILKPWLKPLLEGLEAMVKGGHLDNVVLAMAAESKPRLGLGKTKITAQHWLG